MKCLISLFLCFVWLLPSTGQAAGIEGFYWDVTDRAITTESSGTAGKPEDFRAEVVCLPDDLENYNFAFEYMEADGAFAQDYPEIAHQLTDWYAGVEQAFYADAEEIEEPWDTAWISGRLLNFTVCTLEELGQDVWGYRFQAALFDLVTGKRLALSDLFYEDVNYIRYINEQAALALMGDEDYAQYYGRLLTEEDLRRPFSGFPRDYPHFTVQDGEHGGRMLVLEVDWENPLFSVLGITKEKDSPMIRIPLTDDVSPYGLPWIGIAAHPEELPLTGADGEAIAFYVARVNLGETGNSEVQRKMNEALEKLAARAKGHPLFVTAAYDVLPEISYDETSFSVEYWLPYVSEHVGLSSASLLGTLWIDVRTGEEILGETLFVHHLGEKGVKLYRKGIGAARSWADDDELIAYELPIGATYLGAWPAYQEGGNWVLRIAYFDPAGFEVHMVIPRDLLSEDDLPQGMWASIDSMYE